ncbi:ATP-dependent helicase [Ectothiorhodospiraceae bacterium WFHF3C12]|nr:ATP-dependent helicase [Ectothiorhodospiraceae bacterium WFHF3C12]
MLDDDQKRVVAHETGPAVVLAGAGSGKTRCTTERARRRLVDSGVPSDGLILLTFTNKAAGEMRERLRERLPAGVEAPWIGTFHSFGNRLLRSHGKAIGVPRNATLMDADDAQRMLDALLAPGFPERPARVEALRLREAVAANGLDVAREADEPGIAALWERAGWNAATGRRFLGALRRYEEEKRQARVLDFSDLILLPARLLRQEPALRERVAAGLRDVTVDEAQDTDAAQFRLLQLITPEDRTVLLVGDDDQAIYEWRHARPENMGDFIDRYSATVYRLERNYRSTPAIVTSGASLVRHNTARLEKTPYAVRSAPQADVVRLARYDDGDAMAEGVAERIAADLARGVSAADMAVLYRKNRLSRTLETALLRHGIAYRIKAGTDLLGHADVRMMLAAGRLAANPRDVRALSRLADLVPGLGAKGVARLLEGGGNPLENMARVPAKAAQGVDALREGVRRLSQSGPTGLLQWCEHTPVFARWLDQRARARLKAAGRAGDRQEVAQALRPAFGRMGAVQRAMEKRLESLPREAGHEQRWATALEVVASGADEAESAEAKVTLCTVHAAKGLEWPVVHVFGFSEGLMPMSREDTVENLAEERRLAYVALTRAQNNAVLHHAERLDLGGGQGAQPLEVSRFLEELQAHGQPVKMVDRRAGSEETAAGPEAASDWLAAMRAQLS